jgi:hypothetical protein
MTISIEKWLALAVFGLVACNGKDVDLGDGPGTTSSAITYKAGCTPASCANQSAACAEAVGGPPVTTSLQCIPDPNAGQGSDPVGSCTLEAVCTPSDAGSNPITYTGGCTPASCADQQAACAEPAGSPPTTVTLECSPDPNAGQGSDPVGSCTLEAICRSSDGG